MTKALHAVTIAAIYTTVAIAVAVTITVAVAIAVPITVAAIRSTAAGTRIAHGGILFAGVRGRARAERDG